LALNQINDNNILREKKNNSDVRRVPEFSAVVHNIENFEELKDEAMLYEKINCSIRKQRRSRQFQQKSSER